jgi:site-specific DNA-methyltransferase (adenine-specific)
MKLVPYYQSGGITIYHGDCTEVLPQLKCKVNTIYTDPPFVGNQYVPIYRPTWIGCDKLLNKNGLIFIDIGQNLIPEIINGVPKTWEYLWCLCHVFSRPRRYWPLGIRVGWRPRLIFGKQHKEKFGWFSDASITEKEKKNYNKAYHKWGGSARGTINTMRKFKVEGPILDPFMGGGAHIVGAKFLGLKATGIEIEEKNCEIAAKRLERDISTKGWENLFVSKRT